MKILLDENLSESLVLALQQLGHKVDSVNSLRLKGIDNSTLYRQVAQRYDLCFTKDAGFVHSVRQMHGPSKTKLLRVILPQQPANLFVDSFEAVEQTPSLYETEAFTAEHAKHAEDTIETSILNLSGLCALCGRMTKTRN